MSSPLVISVGLPAEMAAGIVHAPNWEQLAAAARSIGYDGRIMAPVSTGDAAPLARYAGITIAGSVSVVEQLLRLGLLSELRLIVHPLVLGSGRRLFEAPGMPRLELRHTASRRFASGARLDVYAPHRDRTPEQS